MRLFILLLSLLMPLASQAASFPYVTLNAKTNRLSDNGTNFTRNGVALTGTIPGTVSNNVASAGLLAVDASKTNGIAATAAHVVSALGFTPANSNNVPSLIVGTVSNAVASAGILAVDSTKTNGIAATAAHVVSALGFTPANSNNVPTITPGTVINTVAPFGGGVPLVFAGTDTTNAVPGYGGRPVTYVAGNHTISYTNNGTLLRHNDATNSFETFSDGATNGFAITIKNLGVGSVILTNTAGKTFDSLASISLLTGVILDVRADGTNYITDQVSPKTITTGNTFFASPSDGSSGVPAMRAIVAADVAASIVTSQQTNVSAANPTATATSSIQNGTALTFMRSDASPALPQALSTASSPTFNLLSAADTLLGGIAISRGTLTHAGGNVIVDFSGTNRYWSCTITGNVTFVLTNAAVGKHANIFLNNSQATNCAPTFNFPANSTTNFFGGAPSTLTAATFGSLSYFCIDATTNSTKAAYTESQ